MERIKCRRQPIRYDSKGLRVKIQRDSPTPDTTLDNLAVNDVSIKGCSIAVDGKCYLNQSDNVTLSFHYLNNTTESSIDAKITYVIEYDKGKKRIGFLFNSELRPESLGGFGSYFVSPVNDAQTNNSLFENQKPIAQNDIDALRRDVLHLKNCQFQLILGALPVFAAQGATTIPMLSLKAGEVIPVWAISIPIICILLSYMMLIVFLQKTGSIRRNLAFVMILQRHMVMGSFPSCYRGWQDAYENYIQILRHGDKNKYIDGSGEKQFSIIPTDAFTWFGIAVLGVVPVLSIVFLWTMLWLMKTEPNIYTIVVSGITVIGMILSLHVFYKIYVLLRGNHSFRKTIVFFSKILKYSPPFNPNNIEKN